MNLQEAKDKHRLFWDYMKNVTIEEIVKNNFDIINIKMYVFNKIKEIDLLSFYCYACTYALQQCRLDKNLDSEWCNYCPIILEKINNMRIINYMPLCFNSYYGNLVNYLEVFNEKKKHKVIFNTIKYKALCEKIRDIKWKE